MKEEKYMYKIHIDSSERYNKEVSLIKIDNGSEVEIARKEGDIDIVPAIKALLDENKVSVNDLQEIEPNLGPGSFTGLKIGVTVANVLEWALGKRTINNLYIPEYGKEPNINL